jgi:alpha-1,2-glucosyltransferase
VSGRQTSVVWVAFTAGASLIALLPTSDASPTVSLRKLLSPSIRAKTFALAAPFGSVGMIFAVFVSLNGGVAVGDKEHHAVGINVMQPCYLALFLFVFLAPWLATAARPISLIRSSALLDQLRIRADDCTNAAQPVVIANIARLDCTRY